MSQDTFPTTRSNRDRIQELEEKVDTLDKALMGLGEKYHKLADRVDELEDSE